MKLVSAIIFNTGTDILPEIVEFINLHNGIHTSEIEMVYLNNCYDDFFDDIYRLGPIPEYDMNLKKDFVKKQKYPQVAYILSIIFAELTEVYSERKNKNVYVESELLKKEIRDRFKKHIDGYFHDILYHSSDCDEEQAYLIQLISTYKNNCGYEQLSVNEDSKGKVKKLEYRPKRNLNQE